MRCDVMRCDAMFRLHADDVAATWHACEPMMCRHIPLADGGRDALHMHMQQTIHMMSCIHEQQVPCTDHAHAGRSTCTRAHPLSQPNTVSTHACLDPTRITQHDLNANFTHQPHMQLTSVRHSNQQQATQNSNSSMHLVMLLAFAHTKQHKFTAHDSSVVHPCNGRIALS